MILVQGIKDNFTNKCFNEFYISWKDGTGFLALVHSHKPDLFEYSKIDPVIIYYQFSLFIII
jgi:hypothetical protein